MFMKSNMVIHPDELSKRWIDRLARAGVEVLGIHPHGGKEAADSLKSLVELMKTRRFRELIDYAIDCGLEIEYELHAAGYLLPRNLFDTYPEYFRMNDDGKRTNDSNFCVSNGKALDIFARNAAELALSLYRSCHRFYFWMDDGRDLGCHCPKCRSLSASDRQMLVINRILSEIRKHLPDAQMAYLAYMDTLLPPEKIKPNDGVFLEYAPFEKYTAKGDQAQIFVSREKEMLAPLMRCFGNSRKKVLEYWYDNSLFSVWKKPPAKFIPDLEAMEKDMAEYCKIGFDVVCTFACFLGEDYEKLHGSFDITPFAECAKKIGPKA